MVIGTGFVGQGSRDEAGASEDRVTSGGGCGIYWWDLNSFLIPVLGVHWDPLPPPRGYPRPWVVGVGRTCPGGGVPLN